MDMELKEFARQLLPIPVLETRIEKLDSIKASNTDVFALETRCEQAYLSKYVFAE